MKHKKHLRKQQDGSGNDDEADDRAQVRNFIKVSISPTFYEHLFSYESVFCSFSLFTVWLCNFLVKDKC